MTARRTLTLGLGIFVIAGALLYVYSSGPQTYTTEGRVAEIRNQGHTLVVEHEDIPGYMPAMIMSLPVVDPSMTESLTEGDAIRFRLAVSSDRAQITAVHPVPDSAVARHPARTVTRIDPRASDRSSPLEKGDPVPADVELVDHTGRSFRLGTYRDQVLLLTFLYTRCPLPTYCPRMSRQFSALQSPLRERYGPQVQLLSISFDPAHDTPDVLREYGSRYTDRFDTWTFATGDTTNIQRATDLFGVYTRQDEEEITHNLTTALIDPAGRVHRLWRGNDWNTDDVLNAVEQVINGS